MNLGILAQAPRRTAVWMTVAAGLVLIGLAIDLGFTRPRAAEARSLAARRAALSAELTSLAAQGWAARRIRDRLGAEAPAEAPSPPGSDLAWLAREIDAAGLRRLEIVSGNAAVQGRFLVARYSLRATADYDRVLDLLQRLESDRRLVIVESLRLQPAGSPGELEAGMDLALVSPAPGAGAAQP